jgi:hypothetical protein
MNREQAKKPFDVLEFKRQVQADIYEATRHMTPEQEVTYYHARAQSGPFADWLKVVMQATAARAIGLDPSSIDLRQRPRSRPAASRRSR